MRPEFSELLLDIYPELSDNLNMVLRNEPLKFMAKSVYFWSHNHPEDSSPLTQSRFLFSLHVVQF